jgi:hypothetical protein
MGSKGRYSKPPQWWKHLKDYKQVFWSQEREGAKKDLRKEIDDAIEDQNYET